MSDLYYIREARDEDIPFITSTWLKSYRSANAVKRVHNGTYFANQHNLICDLLACSTTLVAVATRPAGAPADEKDQLLGFITAQAGVPIAVVVHYVYTKHAFRRFGVASDLLGSVTYALKAPAGCPVLSSHYTRDWEACPWGKSELYNPYLAWRTKNG